MTFYTYVIAQINHSQTNGWCLAKLQGEGQDAEYVAVMILTHLDLTFIYCPAFCFPASSLMELSKTRKKKSCISLMQPKKEKSL